MAVHASFFLRVPQPFPFISILGTVFRYELVLVCAFSYFHVNMLRLSLSRRVYSCSMLCCIHRRRTCSSVMSPSLMLPSETDPARCSHVCHNKCGGICRLLWRECKDHPCQRCDEEAVAGGLYNLRKKDSLFGWRRDVICPALGKAIEQPHSLFYLMNLRGGDTAYYLPLRLN